MSKELNKSVVSYEYLQPQYKCQGAREVDQGVGPLLSLTT